MDDVDHSPEREKIRRPRTGRWTAEEFSEEVMERCVLFLLAREMVEETAHWAWKDRLLGGGRNPWAGPFEWDEQEQE